MKAGIIAALVSLLVAGQLRAQSDHPKAFAGFAAGVAMPQSSFANKEVGESGTGFAETGFTYNINAGYRFANNFALVAMAHSQEHNRNMHPIADRMNYQYPFQEFSIESDKWRRVGALAGLQAIMPIGVEKKAAIDLKALVGIASTTLPENTFYIDQQYFTSSEVKSSDMVYMVGLDFRYNISPRIALSFFASYMASNHEFENIKVTLDDSNEPSYQNASYKIETLHSGIGVAYRFF